MAEGIPTGSELTPQIDLDLDELDDKEFDLPSVEEPPSLESILNDPDDTLLDVGTQNLLQGEPSDTASVASQDGVMADGKSKKKAKKNVRYEQHGSVLRHVALKGVSAQIQSAIEKVDAGMPTAMDVSAQIAVGTSHGLVLVFDPRQVLKWCLGNTTVGAEYGAVSAISFNHDCTRLLAGFAKGQMTMWDITQGKLIRTISDAHPPGTAILHVKFTDDPTLAVCSDSGGSVFELEFKRLMGVRSCESRCLFSGSRGEVCSIEPLHTSHISEDHPMKDVIILAMASLSKVLIVTLRPHLKVIYTQMLKGDAATLPLLAWQFVMIQVSSSNRVMDPVLAFARDHTIHFYQVVCHGPDDIHFSQLQKTEVPYKLLALTWMNSRTLVVIDTSERAHVIDVRSEEELEVIDLVDVQLVYSTSFYKSLATGGNVSKALAYAGERACYQSVVSYNGQLILLGTKAIHVMTLRTWRERIDVLLRQGDYQGALSMGLRFYKGEAKGLVGLIGSAQKRRQDIADRMLEVLEQFVEVSMTINCPGHGKLELLEEYYQNVVPVCVDNCLTLNRVDMLFGEIFERFSSDVIAKGVFLECLEPYIVSDKLTSVTPVVMKEFVDHYQERGMLTNVEACIVHMDIASLDLHQVVSLCRGNGLYDAIMYIYNTGMADYVTPLEELLLQLQKAVNTGKQLSDESIKMGNKLLVYISCSLAGMAYPRGDIPHDLRSKVKDQVFACVTCLHTKNHPEDEPTYPHLRTLLHFDTREFFNVLSLAFEEPEFNEGEGISKRQRVIDILIQIMVEGTGFTPTQVGILFTFLARQIARHSNILVNRMLFEQVLEALANPSEETRHEERQQALLELLSAGGLQQFNENRLLQLAEEAKFYQVCELLYERNRQFDKILSCYSRDPTRKHQVFSYTEHLMLSQQFSAEEKSAVEKQALSTMRDFVEIDSGRAAQLVLGVFASRLTDVVNRLADSEDLLYSFLSGILDISEVTGVPAYQERQVVVEASIQECYIGLMCKRQPDRVAPYLHASEGYRLQETLEICKHYKIADATAFLLEKTGDIQGAFDILLQSLKSKLETYHKELKKSPSQEEIIEEVLGSWTAVKSCLGVLIQLCQRHSPKLEEAQRQALWFPLLEALMASQKFLKENVNKQHLDDMKAETSQVLNSMMSFITLPAILQKIMQDPSYSSGKFGDIRELILGMLETYNYEKTLLKTCNSLVSHDLHVHLVALTAAASRGLALRDQSCCLCNRPFGTARDSDVILGFRCGHGYHQPCLKAVGSCVIMDGEELWMCYLCNKAKRNTGHATSRIRLSSSSSASLHHSLTTLPGFSKPTVQEGELDPEQIHAIENLRRVQKTHSRLAILNELSKSDSSGWRSTTSTNILQNEHFQLRLAAPPPQF